MKIEGMIFFSFYGPAASNLSGDLSEKLELLLLLGWVSWSVTISLYPVSETLLNISKSTLWETDLEICSTSSSIPSFFSIFITFAGEMISSRHTLTWLLQEFLEDFLKSFLCTWCVIVFAFWLGISVRVWTRMERPGPVILYKTDMRNMIAYGRWEEMLAEVRNESAPASRQIKIMRRLPSEGQWRKKQEGGM